MNNTENKSWREDPATDAQKRRLKSEGLKYKLGMTKGQASDLIGTTEDAEDWQIECMKFFKVKGAAKMNQTDARRALDTLFASDENKQRWENRPADKEQKDIYRFFNLKVPKSLKYNDAEEHINELFKDENKYEKWDSYSTEQEEIESEKEDRLEYLDDLRMNYNDSAELYDCKKINKTKFKKIYQKLESSGATFEQFENYDRKTEKKYFNIALNMYPDLQRKNSGRSRRVRGKKQKSSDTLIGIIVVIFILYYCGTKI